jgi:hypothetical protein
MEPKVMVISYLLIVFLSVMLSKMVWISWLFLCIAYIAYQHKSEFWFFMLPRAIGFYMSYAYCTCMSLCSFFQLCFRSHMFREINAATKQLLHSCWVVGSSPELGYKYGVSFFLGCWVCTLFAIWLLWLRGLVIVTFSLLSAKDFHF